MISIDSAATVHESAAIGEGSRIWGLAQIREHATVGRECVIGRGAYVGVGVRIGDRVKVQNLAQIYEPATVESGVFIGPGAILTNDVYPRAVTPSGAVATPNDWEPVGVHVNEGASIGAGAVCVAPATIGRWAMVAAGATVVGDVPDYALVAGTPASRLGWVGPAGRRLHQLDETTWQCPVTGERFTERGGRLLEQEKNQ